MGFATSESLIGDGWLSNNSDGKRKDWGICSSCVSFLRDINKYILNNKGYIVKTNKNCWAVKIYKKQDIIWIGKNLYKDDGAFGLLRKKEKFVWEKL